MHFIARTILLGSAIAFQADPTSAQPVTATQQPRIADHAEMAAMFEADQAIRRRLSTEGFQQSIIKEMIEGDARHYTRTKELVRSDALKTGNDFYNAAFIFQHGSIPADYLLAHTLAVAAAARGHAKASWIAAATLDRYLQSIDQKQIYGTQFSTKSGEPTTQEPYDRVLIPDSLRTTLGVPVQAEQEKRRAGIAKPPATAKPVGTK